MTERNLLAISIKHTENRWKYRWKFGMPFVLFGHRTSDDEPRSFGGYTIFPNHAELYTLGDFEGRGYDPEWMKLDAPVKLEIGFFEKWKNYDIVLVRYDDYITYCNAKMYKEEKKMKQIFTPKDAAIILRDTPIDIKSTREDDIHTIYATAMMMAIEVLEDFDKFRWHDLRKDPDDLPDAEYGESDTVLCQEEIGTYILLYFDGGNWCYPTGECYERNKDYQKIIAWKEIEPFVGGGEGD